MTLRELWQRLLGAVGSGPRETDLASELDLHRDLLEAEYRRRGMDAGAARRAASIALGNAAQITERWRDQRGWPFVDALRQDVRDGLRALRRTPGVTAAALATLAIGVGANAAIFSVVDAVLLRPLPFAHADRLVTIGDRNDDGSAANVGFATITDWKARSRSLEDVAAIRLFTPTLVVNAEGERLEGLRVSWNYFQVLGAAPALGRSFLPAEDQPSNWSTAVIADSLWRRRFDADPSIVGRSIELNGRPFHVIGVMPPSFQPLDAQRYFRQTPEVWAALGYNASGSASGSCRSCQHLRAIARLRPGVTVAAATAEMDAIREQLRREHPGDYEAGSIAIEPLRTAFTRNARGVLLVLLGAVGFVLLIACANVANLQLARGAARQRELTVRAALGAGPGRLVRQLLTEQALLTGAGMAAGVALAAAVVRGLSALAPATLPRAAEATVDVRVMAFTATLAAATGLLFGMAPAWHGASSGVLVTDMRASIGGRGRARSLLVVFDLALALALVAGAGLMLRTVATMTAADPGFDSRGVLSLRFSLSGPKYGSDEAIVAFEQRLLERLRALPGVRRAALAGQLPFQGVQDCWGFHASGHTRPNPADDPCVDRYPVTSGYFQTLGIPLLAGREFTDDDSATSAPVIVVSEATARAIWGTASPIGAQVRIGPAAGRWRTVIGVARDVHHDDLTTPPAPAMYTPESQVTSAYLTAVLDSERADPGALAAPVRAVLRELDPAIPVYAIQPLSALVDASSDERRFVLRLLGAFSGVALLLAGVGLYGLLSGMITERTRELGLRAALGASRGAIVRLVLTRGFVLVAAGVFVGTMGAATLTRSLRGLIFGVSSFDPVAFGGAALLLLAVAVLAHWVPVRRALRIDPAIALRDE